MNLIFKRIKGSGGITRSFSAFVILSLLFVFACSQPEKNDNLLIRGGVDLKTVEFNFRSFPTMRSITGEVLNFEGRLSMLNRVLVNDSKLIITDLNADAMVQGYDLDQGKYLGVLSKKGFGPNEMMGTWTLSRSLDGNGFTVFDNQLRKLNNFHFSDTGFVLNQTQVAKSEAVISSAIQVTDSTLLAIDIRSGSVLVEVSLDGTRSLATMDWDQIGIPYDLERALLNDLFQGYLFASADQAHFLRTSLVLNEAMLSSRNLKKAIRFQGPEAPSSEFRLITANSRKQVELDFQKTAYTYLGGDVTEKAVYLLYAGQKWEGKPGEKYYANKVFQFALDGTPLKAYELDVAISCLSVDEENGVFYGVSANQENTELLRFTLE